MSLKHLEQRFKKDLKKKSNRELTTFLLTRKVEGLIRENKKLLEKNTERRKQERRDALFKNILKETYPLIYREIVEETQKKWKEN